MNKNYNKINLQISSLEFHLPMSKINKIANIFISSNLKKKNPNKPKLIHKFIKRHLIIPQMNKKFLINMNF